MNQYKFKATNLIADYFNQHDIRFHVISRPDSEQLLAGFSVNCGPNVFLRFISRDHNNDVAVRLFGLVSNTPNKKRPRVMEACNILNRKVRFMKFFVDIDGDINVEYDFPVGLSDDCVGDVAFEILARTMAILDNEYEIFMKAIHTNESLEPANVDTGLLANLLALHKQREAHAENEDETPPDTDLDDDPDEHDMEFIRSLFGTEEHEPGAPAPTESVDDDSMGKLLMQLGELEEIFDENPEYVARTLGSALDSILRAKRDDDAESTISEEAEDLNVV